MKIIEYYGLKDVLDRELGIEVEMEGENLYIPNLSYWNILNDGSLRGNAVEYVLKAPVKRNLAHSRVDYLYRKLKENSQLDPSDRCGVHLHVNCQHNTFKEVFNFITLYLIFEDVLVHWCGEDREGNMFCLRSSDAEWLIYNLVKDRELGVFNRTADSQNFRYASVNISAIRKYGSIEFRSLRTPKSSKRIKDWIDLITCLKDKAVKVESPIDFISGASLNGPKDFAKRVFGPRFSLIDCPGVEDMIMDGIRRIQAVAYTDLGDPKKSDKRAVLNQDFIMEEAEIGVNRPPPPRPVNPPRAVPAPRRRRPQALRN